MKNLLLLLLLLPFAACTSDDDAAELTPLSCGPEVQIGPESSWPNAPRIEGATVKSVNGTEIEFSYRRIGCSDRGGPVGLFTTGEVAESSPTQTTATLSFCEDGGVQTCDIEDDERVIIDVAAYIGTDRPTLLTIVGADTTLLIE